jgi:hypothetical protein
MKTFQRHGTLLRGSLRRLALLFVCIPIFCGMASAQATVEYGGATAVAANTSASIKPPNWTVNMPKPSGPSAANKSGTYLIIATSPAADVVNRRALEQQAGKDAGKLLVRSLPTASRVWINGKFVGITPILLIVPPGKYHLELQGKRLDSSEQNIALLPRETREIAVPLRARYPTRVSIR